MSAKALASALGMRARLVRPVDLVELDQALIDPKTGRMRLLPSAELLRLGLERLQVWAGLRARYQLVTLELVQWLRSAIGPRSALEVGAGMGDVGFHLGIRMTDSHIQVRNRIVREYYAALGQTPTTPPRDVERIDANAAVRLYKPEVVVACWLTQYGPAGVLDSSSWGAHEEQFLERAEYIHVGNVTVHGRKRLLSLPHHLFTPEGLVSRAEQPEQNAVWVWERHHAG